MSQKFTPGGSNKKFAPKSQNNVNQTGNSGAKFKNSGGTGNNGGFTGGNRGFRPNNAEPEPQPEEEKPKKERKPINKKKLGIGLAVGFMLLGGGYYYYYTNVETGLPAQIEFVQSKDYVFDTMMKSWGTPKDSNTYDTKKYKSVVAKPYLNDELPYFNRDAHKMEYFQTILSQVKFQPEKDTLTSRQGKKVEYLGSYEDNKYTFVVPDFEKIQARVTNLDYGAIQEVYKQRKLDKKDYQYEKKMVDLYIDYILSLGELPTKKVKMELEVVPDGKGYKLQDDSQLDNLLFASEEFHNLLDTFSAVANGDIGELKDNPEYALWKKQADKYNADQVKNIKEEVESKFVEPEPETATTESKTQDSNTQSSGETTTSTTEPENNMSKEAKQKTSEIQAKLDEINKEAESNLTEFQQKQRKTDLKMKKFFLGVQTYQDTPEDGKFVTKQVKPGEEDTTSDTDGENIYSIYEQKQKEEEEQRKLEEQITKQDQEMTKLQEELTKLEAITDEKEKEKNAKHLEDVKNKIKEIQINKEVSEAQQNLLETEKVEQQDADSLSRMEKLIGLEPPQKTFIRKQQPNPEWEIWNKLANKEDILEPTKTVNEPLKPQQNITYKWIGAYYLQNNYVDSNGKKVVIKPQVGDGTQGYPATLGTTVQAKGYDSGNNLRDVKVILSKVLIDKDAIKYVQSFDDRNEGFDKTADNTLVAIEYKVLNLEDKEIELTSGFQLVDIDGNPIARNGQMYALKEKVKIKPHEVATMQDWFYTQDPQSLFLVWGKRQEKSEYKWFDTLQYDTMNEKELKKAKKDHQDAEKSDPDAEVNEVIDGNN